MHLVQLWFHYSVPVSGRNWMAQRPIWISISSNWLYCFPQLNFLRFLDIGRIHKKRKSLVAFIPSISGLGPPSRFDLFPNTTILRDLLFGLLAFPFLFCLLQMPFLKVWTKRFRNYELTQNLCLSIIYMWNFSQVW